MSGQQLLLVPWEAKTGGGGGGGDGGGTGDGGALPAWPETVDHGPTGFTASRTVNVASASALQTAIANAVGGDDIVIAGGNYTGSWLFNTKPTSTVRVRAADGATVTLTSDTTSGATFALRKADNWIIGSTAGKIVLDGANDAMAVLAIGLTSGTKGTAPASAGPCNNIHVHNVEIRNAGQALVRIAYDSSNITLSDSFLWRAGRARPEYGEGVYIGSASGTADLTNNVKLLGLEITGIPCEALDFKDNSHTITVDGCLIHDIGLNSPTTSTRGGIAQRTTGANVLIKNTRVWNITRVGGTNNEAVGIYASAAFTAENVVIWGCEQGGVRMDGYANGAAVVGTFKHCTWWNNGAPATGSTTARSVNLTNSAKASLDVSLYPSGTLHTGVTTTNSGTVTSGDFTGPLTGAAKTTYAGDGFIPVAGSVHVNSVTAVLATDLRALSRPQGAASERGAFERTTR